MKEKIKEFLKNILIVLLICTLLLLCIAVLPSHTIRSTPWLAQVLQPIAPLLGLPEAELTYVARADTVTDAAHPVAISIRTGGGRCSIMWDFSRLDRTFSLFEPLLGQSLSATSGFNTVTLSQIQTALSAPSVYFRYGSRLPTELLASWVDAQIQADVPESEICILSAQDETITVYLLGKELLAAKTQLSSEELLELMDSFDPDGSMFAFEAGSSLHALSLLPASTPAVPAATASNPCDSRYIDALATALGFNPYGEGRYTDDQGTVLFSETNASLHITADGEITYDAERAQFTAGSSKAEALAETARRLCDIVTESIPGEGRLYLAEFTRSGQETVCRFEYLVSGIGVAMSRPAATITFDGLSVRSAIFCVRSFTGSGKVTYPLPVTQAAAVLEEGSHLELSYCINADNTLSAGWLR